MGSGVFIRVNDEIVLVEELSQEGFDCLFAGKSQVELIRWVDMLRKVLKQKDEMLEYMKQMRLKEMALTG